MLDVRDGRRGLGALVRDLADGSTTLLRDEMRLAQDEIGRAAAGVGKGAALVASGAVVALIGGLSLLAGLVLLIGDQWLPSDLYWVAALIVLVVAGAIAAVFAKRGMARLAPSRLVPRETTTTLEENAEWLKRQLTSGATSK